MDIDILKPSTGYLTVERPVPSSSRASLDQRSGDTTPLHTYAEPVSEGEEDEAMDLALARDEVTRTGLPRVDVAAAIAYREIALKGRSFHTSDATSGSGPASREEEQKPVDERTPLLGGVQEQRMPKAQHKSLSINPLALSTAFDKTLKERMDGNQTAASPTAPRSPREARGLNEEEIPEQQRLLVRDWTAPSGKKIAVPVRVEPKVYFANERTFLASFFFCLLYIVCVLTRWGH